jgi:uncharacterized protein (DUF983 family)
MDYCKGCGERYDYTDRGNLVSLGLLSNTTKCPNCGHKHRTDYISFTIVFISSSLIIYASYLLVKSGYEDLYRHRTELLLFAIGVIGVFLGLKSTRLVRVNDA